jgi:polysaccharide biosynthesis protein PslH
VRILWVKAGGLLPLDSGGRIRSYNLVRELAKRHQVTFFGFHAGGSSGTHAELSNFCEQVVCVPLDLPPAKSFAEFREYLSGILSRQPYNLRKYCRRQVASELRLLVQRERFDVLVCDFLVPAAAVPWDIPCPKVLFTHNVEATIWRRHYEVASNPLWKLLSWREWRAMEGAEKQYLQKADVVIAVSVADRDVFAQVISPEKIAVTATGVDVEYFQPRPGTEEEKTLVFTGSMDWLPNEDGIFYFMQEILPRIAQEIPAVKLIVVGRRPSPRMQSLAETNAQVQLTGRVEDIRPHLARGTVCIVPLRIGSGTRLKIFEAMAMAKPVVSTTIGAEGLAVQHGTHLFLADSPEDFAKYVILLLRDETLRERLGAAARSLVENNFSWSSVAREFEAVLERSLAKGAGSGERAARTEDAVLG